MNTEFRGENLIFIAGCPRSGTTYLQKMLTALPAVKTGQESHLFYLVDPLWSRWRAQCKGALKKPARGVVGMPYYFSKDEFKKVVRGALFELFQPMISNLGDGEFFLEKTPSNALYIDTIHELLPKARIIHIQRDARSVVASVLAASRSWGKGIFPDTPITASRLWCDHFSSVKRAAKSLPASCFFELKYEDLVAEPEIYLEKVIDFLGLPCSKEEIMLSVQENRLDVARRTGGTQIHAERKNSGFEVSTEKEPDGFVRKGKPDSWKTDLSFYEKLCVWAIARSKMKLAGYSWKFPL